MLLHAARHGQVQRPAPGEIEDVEYPLNDRPLSALGRRQAELLGNRLVAGGFASTVYVSPFIRTVETGQIIADIADCPVVLCPAIREAVYVPERTEGFRGATAEQLIRQFGRVRVPEDFPYPWWDNRKELSLDVEARVGPFIDTLVKRGEREALLIGHGSSIQAAIRWVLRTHSPQHLDQIPPTKPWNCALTSFQLSPSPSFELLAMVCTIHLPEEAVTSNSSPKADVLRRYHQRQAERKT